MTFVVRFDKIMESKNKNRGLLPLIFISRTNQSTGGRKLKHRNTHHGNEHLSKEAQAIAEKVVGNSGTTILGNTDFFARRMGWGTRTTAKALSELVQAKILFRDPDGFLTNRPPRKTTPHQGALANLQPALAGN